MLFFKNAAKKRGGCVSLFINIKSWFKKDKVIKYQKDSVNLEISSVCNAKCTYCPTGVGKHLVDTKYMTLELFEKVVKHLIKIEVLNPEVRGINLYNWGEPFIHPNLDEILTILGKYNLKAMFSSNFIKFPKISEKNYKNISTVTFSLCSLDKERYKNIYKADLDKVLENYNKFLEQKNKFNPSIVMSVNWLRYHFNDDEYDYAKNYFNERNVHAIGDNFYAMLADKNTWLDLTEGKTNPEDAKYYDIEQAFKDINFEREKKLIKKFKPEKFKPSDCPQRKILAIGEDGQLVGCCAIYSGCSDYNLGNFLEMDKKQIYKLQHSMKSCERCCKYNAAWYSHNFWKYQDKDLEDIELLENGNIIVK